ncbi:right-handed parallel beta-helix repeat-containing protein [Micromonospora sp. DT201]
MRFDGNGRHAGVGVVVEPSAGGTTIERCEFVDVAGAAIVVRADRTRVVRCRANHCGRRVESPLNSTIVVEAANHCSVVDNELRDCDSGVTYQADNASTGISFYECRGNSIGCGSPPPGGSVGIGSSFGRSARIEGNTVRGFSSASISCAGGRDVAIVGNGTQGGSDGVYVGGDASDSVTITGNVFNGPARGVRVASGVALIAGVVVSGNTVSRPTDAGILVEESGTAQVTGITIADNDLHIADSGDYGVRMVSAEVSRISGNRIHRPNHQAILLQGVDLITVNNNMMLDAGRSAAKTIDAISVIDSNRVLLRDNLAYGSTRYAIGVTGGVGMTATGTRWRGLKGGVDSSAPNTVYADNASLDTSAVRIMPLGDSITVGVGDGAALDAELGGYRVGLWKSLTAAGYPVDFVGGAMSGPPLDLGDRDHQGKSGDQTGNVSAIIVQAIQRHLPHVVLLHIGTNDINAGLFEGAADRLRNLLDQILAIVPDVHLFVAQIVRRRGGDATKASQTVAYNADVAHIAQEKKTAGFNVYVVDMFNRLTVDDFTDTLHPNGDGYIKMAAGWYEALLAHSESLRAH